MNLSKGSSLFIQKLFFISQKNYAIKTLSLYLKHL